MTTITLETAIKRGEKDITSIELRKPNSGALRGVKITDVITLDVTTIQTLIPRISEPALTKAEVDQLDLADLTAIGVEIAGFFAPKSLQA